MEEKERSRSRSLSRSRRATRVQQVVGTLIRRTRESLSRERILGDGRSNRSGSVTSQNFPVRLTVQIVRDPVLDSSGHGFSLSKQHLCWSGTWLQVGRARVCLRERESERSL
ncbi:unnamed protein product [Oncorhynchus mykiss]|uniref:Uncharacterized protein n=1 Tax=Oncorhynchus mykiss TaxID=8022 RepID=A0A060ZAX0_ONCMY|nr:unnamed protein product [Oncorhynchus mykiss]